MTRKTIIAEFTSGDFAIREFDRRRFCRDSLYLAAAGLLAGKGVLGSVVRAQSLPAAPAPVASAQYAFFDGVVSGSMNEAAAAAAASAQPPARQSDFFV